MIGKGKCTKDFTLCVSFQVLAPFLCNEWLLIGYPMACNRSEGHNFVLEKMLARSVVQSLTLQLLGRKAVHWSVGS